MRHRVETSLQLWIDQERRLAHAHGSHRYWADRRVGIILFALGRYDEALRRLTAAADSQNHDCSTSAKAFAALAVWKLGRKDEARNWRAEAEEGFQIKAGNGLLDSGWRHMAATELALQNARRLMGE